MSAVEQLEALARAKRWRLRWKSASLRFAPSLMCTELDLFRGRELLTTDGPLFLIHSRDVDARERIARQALMLLDRQQARAA